MPAISFACLTVEFREFLASAHYQRNLVIGRYPPRTYGLLRLCVVGMSNSQLLISFISIY